MIIEQKLMRNLMRAGGSARRHPNRSDSRLPKGRGFGHILDLLSENGISQQQIADSLSIRPQSVSEAVSVLESRGFVRRQPSESDKRVMLICITAEGMRHREEMAQARCQHAVQLFAALTQQEKEQLLYLLEKLNAAADDREKL